MKKYKCSILILTVFFFCRCTNTPAENAEATTKATNHIDSSAIINDSTRLPKDSTVTGVQH